MEIAGELATKWAMMFLAILMCILSLTQAGLNSMDVGDMHAAEFDVKPGGSVHEFEESWVCIKMHVDNCCCFFTCLPACDCVSVSYWLLSLRLRITEHSQVRPKLYIFSNTF